MPRKKDQPADDPAVLPRGTAQLGQVTLYRTRDLFSAPSLDADVLQLGIAEFERTKLEAFRRMHARYPQSCTWQEARMLANWLTSAPSGREVPYDLLGEAGDYVMGAFATPAFVAVWWLGAHAPASGIFPAGIVRDIADALLDLVQVGDAEDSLARLAAFLGDAAREGQLVVLGP